MDLSRVTGNQVIMTLKNKFAMKNICIFIITAAIAAVSCSKIDTQSTKAPFWETTVKLVPAAETKTALDETARLNWTDGDMVSYWTSSDGINYGTSTSAEVVNGKFSAIIPSGHSNIKVVYPAVIDGSAYADPVVKKYQNYPSAGSFDGRYLPMVAVKNDVMEGTASLDVTYTVLGAVLRFKATGPGSLKAVKAGDYQADFLTPAELTATPVDAFVVVPIGAVTYTPKAFVIATDGTYYEYTRNVTKESTFSAKAYEIKLSLGDETKYSSTIGWKKASDIGLSVAWADMNYGSKKPSEYKINGWTDKFDWGEGWRLPTENEMKELASLDTSCKEIVTIDGTDGCLVTNNGASIFLPKGGWYNSYYDRMYNVEAGFYWYDKYYGTAKRDGESYPKHYNMKFNNAGDFSIEYAHFDMDPRGLRLVRPLN